MGGETVPVSSGGEDGRGTGLTLRLAQDLQELSAILTGGETAAAATAEKHKVQCYNLHVANYKPLEDQCLIVLCPLIILVTTYCLSIDYCVYTHFHILHKHTHVLTYT